MIRTNNLHFAYDATPVLQDVSIEIPDNDYVIIAGPNGSGKTTLVQHFNGLLTPDQGTITLDGTSITDNLVATRRRIGFVFQNPRDSFVAPTVEADIAFGPENLGLPPETINDRVRTALTTVGLEEKSTHTIMDLSDGEQARVAIAGAIAMQPDYLILDEPLTGLDYHARTDVFDHILKLHEDGTCVIVVTHDLHDFIDVADRLLILQDGVIKRDSDPSALVHELSSFGVRPPC